jgi:hypothetical protein
MKKEEEKRKYHYIIKIFLDIFIKNERKTNESKKKTFYSKFKKDKKTNTKKSE